MAKASVRHLTISLEASQAVDGVGIDGLEESPMDYLAIFFFWIHWRFSLGELVEFDVGRGEEIAVDDHDVGDVEGEFSDLFSDVVEECRAFPPPDDHDGVG